jgi:hypothetical protein
VRRACTLFKVARSALSYQGRKAAKDAPVVERMRELSAQSELVRAAVRVKRHTNVRFDTLGFRVARTIRP